MKYSTTPSELQYCTESSTVHNLMGHSIYTKWCTAQLNEVLNSVHAEHDLMDCIIYTKWISLQQH